MTPAQHAAQRAMVLASSYLSDSKEERSNCYVLPSPERQAGMVPHVRQGWDAAAVWTLENVTQRATLRGVQER